MASRKNIRQYSHHCLNALKTSQDLVVMPKVGRWEFMSPRYLPYLACQTVLELAKSLLGIAQCRPLSKSCPAQGLKWPLSHLNSYSQRSGSSLQLYFPVLLISSSVLLPMLATCSTPAKGHLSGVYFSPPNCGPQDLFSCFASS